MNFTDLLRARIPTLLGVRDAARGQLLQEMRQEAPNNTRVRVDEMERSLLKDYLSYLKEHRWGIIDGVILQPMVYHILTRLENSYATIAALLLYLPIKIVKLRSTFFEAYRHSGDLSDYGKLLRYLIILPREFAGFISSYGVDAILHYSYLRNILSSFGLRSALEIGEKTAADEVTSSSEAFERFFVEELPGALERVTSNVVTHPFTVKLVKMARGLRH